MKRDEVLITNDYTQRLLESGWWRNSAEEVWAAAQTLEPKIDDLWKSFSQHRPGPINMTNVYFMLAAFTLEDYCKSILACRLRGKEHVRPMKTLPRSFRTHDLNKLLKTIGLAVNHDEEQLLDRLARSSAWAGRYPVPVQPAQNGANIRFLGPKPYWVERFRRDDVQKVRQLVQRVEEYAQRFSDGSASS